MKLVVVAMLVGLPALARAQPSSVCTWIADAKGVHVRPDPENEPEGPETTLCFLDKKGATTAEIPLGTAICGLGKRVPCAWELRAVSKTLIAFAGLRGQQILVDRANQKIVEFAEPVDYWFPPDFTVCGTTVCIGGILANETKVYGRITLVKGRTVYQPLRPRP